MYIYRQSERGLWVPGLSLLGGLSGPLGLDGPRLLLQPKLRRDLASASSEGPRTGVLGFLIGFVGPKAMEASNLG